MTVAKHLAVLGLNALHVSNLQKMVEGLRLIDVEPLPNFRFTMLHYSTIDRDSTQSTQCGSIGCVLGLSSIVVAPKEKGDCWEEHGHKLFGLGNVCSEVWRWCFSAEWAEIDNSLLGAAARIETFLKYGVPADAYMQCRGIAALSYKVTP